jgi:transposase-like protein
MIKTGRKVRHKRKFSEDFKLKIVRQYEQGKMSVLELEKFYDIGNSIIYSWIYHYSNYNKKGVQVVEYKFSQMNKLKQQEEHIKDLERALGQKQMQIDYLEKMIELAKQEYDIDIKKNSGTPQSSGSKAIKNK